jgi:cbb3-type cytochrome c oxidase subunit III
MLRNFKHQIQFFALAGTLLFAASLLVSGALAQGKGKPKKVNAAAVFAANCARCHGANGKGTALGQSLDTPDLTDKDLQNGMSNSRIRRIILNGDGSMPAFKSKLSAAEVTALTSYVRVFKGK